ncbi:MAG: oligosaccharide flippase family protein [Deltaproteobacteria bacterium]|nr:oligosaccharide flippase family protein [Deltaproteobacteria bacterium]MCL5276194.1 oligosaccharide flippase family protein [Deltaproteobacteria bacterium]
MSLSKILIKNALSNYTGFVVSALVGIFISPIVVHHLGNIGYGLWALFQSFFGYFGLLDLGLGVSVVKYISEFRARGEQDNVNIFGSTIYFTYILLGIIGMLIAFGLAPFVTKIFIIPTGYRHIAFYGMLISGLNIAIIFPMSLQLNSLAAHQRYDLTNGIAITRQIIYAISVILLLKHGFGLLELFLLNFVLSIFTFLVSHFLVVFKYKLIHFHLKLYRFSMLKTAYRYSIFAFLFNLAGQLLSIGNLIISTMLSIEFVTYFALANKLVVIISSTVGSMLNVTTPTFSTLWAINAKEKIRFAYLEITKAVTLISLPISMVVIIFSDPIMEIWVGNGYHLAALSLVLLTVVSFIHNIAYITDHLLLSMGKPKPAAISIAIAAIANLLLAILLTRWIAKDYGAGYGVLGIPIALGLTMNAVDLFFLPWYVNRIIELPHREYIKIFIKPLLFIIPAAILALLIRHYFTPHKLIVFVLESAIIGLFYWGLYYLFGLTDDEKARYVGYVRQFVHKS